MGEAPTRTDFPALLSSVDPFGSYATIDIDQSVYGDVAVFKAAYWFTDKYYLYLSRPEQGKTRVEIRHKLADNKSNLEEICKQFCNSLIDFRVRQFVLGETAEIRDKLVTKAFFEGQKRLLESDINSNEKNIPSPGSSYLSDELGINAWGKNDSGAPKGS